MDFESHVGRTFEYSYQKIVPGNELLRGPGSGGSRNSMRVDEWTREDTAEV